MKGLLHLSVILLLTAFGSGAFAQEPGGGEGGSGGGPSNPVPGVTLNSDSDWLITVELDGELRPTGPNKAVGEGLSWTEAGLAFANASFSDPLTIQTKTAFSEGTIDLTFTWRGVDQFGQPRPAPSAVPIYIDAGALASATAGYLPNHTPGPRSVTVSNGLGDPVVVGSHGGESCSGKHIKLLKVSRGEAHFSFSMEARGTATGNYGSVMAGCTFIVGVSTKWGQLNAQNQVVTVRDDGDLEADTVYSLLYHPSELATVLVTSPGNFTWSSFGPWTAYPDPVWPYSWPHSDIDVKWTPTISGWPTWNKIPMYYFDFSAEGSYYSRLFPTIGVLDAAPYTGSPGTDYLALKLIDNGDGFQFDQKLHVRVHTPMDNFQQDDLDLERTLIQSWYYACQPGVPITVNETHTVTVTHTVDVDVQWEFSFLKQIPFFNGPVSPHIGYQWQEQKSDSTGVTLTYTPPAGAVTFVWKLEKIDAWKVGTVDVWNNAGSVEKGRYARILDQAQTGCSFNFHFLDSTGSIIGAGGGN